jgi:hypothetical protein
MLGFRRWTCSLIRVARVIRFRRGYGGQVDPGYRFIAEQIKASLKKATRATPFWRVGWNFRAAL